MLIIEQFMVCIKHEKVIHMFSQGQ